MHALVLLKKVYDNANGLAALCPGTIKGCRIERPRNFYKAYKYVTKDGDFVEHGEPPKGGTKKTKEELGKEVLKIIDGGGTVDYNKLV